MGLPRKRAGGYTLAESGWDPVWEVAVGGSLVLGPLCQQQGQRDRYGVSAGPPWLPRATLPLPWRESVRTPKPSPTLSAPA